MSDDPARMRDMVALPIDTAPLSDIYEPKGRGMREIMLWVAKGGDYQEGRWAFGYVTVHGPKARGYMGDWEITHWHPVPPNPNEASHV